MDDFETFPFPDISDPTMTPDQLGGEMTWALDHDLRNSPRSLKTGLAGIGVSGCNHRCGRHIGYQLLDIEPVNDQRTPWKSSGIGSWSHDGMEGVYQRLNRVLDPEGKTGPRFLLEHQVTIGEVNGQPLSGRCDCADRVSLTAIDFKFVGDRALAKYRAHGPGDQYRGQIHGYARGWRRRGLPIRNVAIWFLPRDRELDQAHWWSEPYDEQIVLDALTRLEAIDSMTKTAGTAALSLLPTADAFCKFCPYFLPASTEITQACPGHPGATK